MFQAMLNGCKADEIWLKTFLLMSHTWGYRLRELLKLQVARVNLKERTVYLPPRSTKNRKPRPIPISEAEVPLLLSCIEGKAINDFVLTREDGERVRDFRERWDDLVEEAKAGHYEVEGEMQVWYPAIPHDLRRTAISRMLSGGMPRKRCGQSSAISPRR
jgi:integrase